LEISRDNPRKIRKKNFGKQNMAMEFLQQQFPSPQDKLLNLQTQINSGRLTANKDLYFAAMIPS